MIAENFAPGTTAADIESVMLDVGGQMSDCKLVAAQPTVIAEMTFIERTGAETVIGTFNGKKVSTSGVGTSRGKELTETFRRTAVRSTSTGNLAVLAHSAAPNNNSHWICQPLPRKIQSWSTTLWSSMNMLRLVKPRTVRGKSVVVATTILLDLSQLDPRQTVVAMGTTTTTTSVVRSSPTQTGDNLTTEVAEVGGIDTMMADEADTGTTETAVRAGGHSKASHEGLWFDCCGVTKPGSREGRAIEGHDWGGYGIPERWLVASMALWRSEMSVRARRSSKRGTCVYAV